MFDVWIIVLLLGFCCYGNVVTQCVDPPRGGFFGWDDYWDHWYENNLQYRHRLYPFCETYHDLPHLEQTSFMGRGFKITPGFKIPFSDVAYRSLYVSVHGLVTLSTLDDPPVFSYTQVHWPNPLYPEGTDPPFIAPFYGETDLRPGEPPTIEPGRIYSRVLERSEAADVKSRINRGMLDLISEHVHSAVLGSDGFLATHGVIITWYSVTFAGAGCKSASIYDGCKRNTYQLALVTDEIDTYAVFNYYNVTWVGGTRQGCDPNTGKSPLGESQCEPAQVGINLGEARGFQPLPYSGRARVEELDSRGGSTVTGRYFYRVSGVWPFRGGCTNDTTLSSAEWPLSVSPTWADMLGGTEVEISGPCFPPGSNMLCKFDDVIVEGFLDPNIMFARCNVPPLGKVGNVTLSVSNDNGVTYRYQTGFSIGRVDRPSRPGRVVVEATDWLTPGTITLRWDPGQFNPSDSDTQDKVDVQLWVYEEDEEEHRGFWSQILQVYSQQQNIGYSTFDTSTTRCQIEKPEKACLEFDVGAFTVSISGVDPQNPERLWSDPVPLGWFTKEKLYQHYGEDYMHEKCGRWEGSDKNVDGYPAYWSDSLVPCPCSMDQAMADWGRFLLEEDCTNQEAEYSTTCQRHRGATSCFLSVQVTSSGAGSRCCYTAEGELIFSGDNKHGSTSARFHPWGAPPYTYSVRSAPTMPHWLHDVIGWYYCCEWQTDPYDCYNVYLNRRPTAECSNYQPPGFAAVFGDPHVLTFDGMLYTFNGYGEYWLSRVTNVTHPEAPLEFSLQARFQQPLKQFWGGFNATIITAVAAQTRGGQTVEVKVTSSVDGVTRLRVYVDGVSSTFPSPDVREKHFRDVIITTPNAVDVTNVTMVFRTGVGIQVTFRAGMLHVIVTAPREFYDRSLGLLGWWNGEAGDDLKPQGGGAPVNPSNPTGIHYSFGQSWRVAATEALFTYQSRLDHAHFDRPGFIPDLTGAIGVVPEKPSQEKEVQEEDPLEEEQEVVTDDIPVAESRDKRSVTCGGNHACAYDLRMTGSDAVAEATLDTQEVVGREKQRAVLVPVCPYLNVQGTVKQEPISYRAGSHVIITGCRSDMVLEGATSYTCHVTPDGVTYWEPEIDTVCKEKKEVKVERAIMFGVPILIVLVLLIIAIIACCCYCHKRRKLAAQRRAEDKATELATQEFVFADLPGRSVRPPRIPEKKRAPSIDTEDDDLVKPVPRAHHLDQTPSYKDELSDTPMTWGDSSLSSMKPIGAQKAQVLLNDSTEDLLDSWAGDKGRPRENYNHPRQNYGGGEYSGDGRRFDPRSPEGRPGYAQGYVDDDDDVELAGDDRYGYENGYDQRHPYPGDYQHPNSRPTKASPPYAYPTRPEGPPARKKPPYAYPRSTNALNQEETALARAQQRRMRYSDSSDA